MLLLLPLIITYPASRPSANFFGSTFKTCAEYDQFCCTLGSCEADAEKHLHATSYQGMRLGLLIYGWEREGAGLNRGEVLQLREGLSQLHRKVYDWDDFQICPYCGEWLHFLVLHRPIGGYRPPQERGITLMKQLSPAKDGQRNGHYGGNDRSNVIVWDSEATLERMVKRCSFKGADIDLRLGQLNDGLGKREEGAYELGR